MKFALCIVLGDEPSGFGCGDTRGWFRHYKWETFEETWIPVALDSCENLMPEDWLFFLLDGELLGCVQVLRIVEDPAHQRKEIWYDDKKTIRPTNRTPLQYPPVEIY